MKKIFIAAVMLCVGACMSPVRAQETQLPAAPSVDNTEMTEDPALVTPPPPPEEAPGAVVASLPESSAQPGVVLSPIEKEIQEQLAYLRPNIDMDAMKSLFFSVWEHDLLIDARRGLKTRAADSDDGVDNTIVQSGPRDIALGGIVYHSGKEWTIWLNNTRVSPDAIPEEIIDLKVFKEYVELEWFDESTNQIFPIRLRAHQRFNLDTRMFLPG